LLWLITWLGVIVIRLIAPTMKLAVSFEDGAPPSLDTKPLILAFWHSCIFPAIYAWRNLQIRVMSSDSFDGEYTGRIIRKFGFVKVRGSSSKGAVRALLGMRREIEQNATVAFTIDGPRGPRYVAKPGPVLLARKTGRPIYVFHIGVEKAHTLEKAWDKMQIPYFFSRAVMVSAPLITVSPDADAEELKRKHAEMQSALERVRDVAESWFGLSEAERQRLRMEWNDDPSRTT